MDPRDNILSNNPKKPSKIMALAALITAFSLPFALVKFFPHKHTITSEIASIPYLATPISAPKPVLVSHAINVVTEKKQDAIADTTPPIVVPVAKSEWRIIRTRPKDTLANLFTRAHINPKFLTAIKRDNPKSVVFNKLIADQDVQFQLIGAQLTQVIVPLSVTQYLVVYKVGDQYKANIKTRKINSHNHFLTATIHGSLYSTAKRLNISAKLIRQMTDIFTWDVNFARDLRSGDQFTIMYKAFYVEDKLVNTGDILAISLHTRNKTYQAIRHTNRAGQTDYYTPEGTSLKKAFERYPLRFSHISSTFSLARFHPILHYTRSHKGVDLAAPLGTPIKATGDGKIELIGRLNGYGNTVKINHNKLYTTIYGHMLRFQKGLSRGSYVKKGQVIGYVGQSGLASGPHCHYEFRINNNPKNPTTIALPRGNPISSREIALFKANTRTMLAQLNGFEQSQLASNAKPLVKRG